MLWNSGTETQCGTVETGKCQTEHRSRKGNKYERHHSKPSLHRCPSIMALIEACISREELADMPPDRSLLARMFIDRTASLEEDMQIDESNGKKPLINVNAAELYKDEQCSWAWDPESLPKSISLSNNDEEVLFHPDYSCGTATIRGTEPFELGSQHYWEVKMTSAVYGTDMMIGIGSNIVDLHDCRTSFTSFLGKDSESWGLSYLGTIQHKGEMKQFTSKLERDCVIGMHLDLWHGTLSIYNDGKPCGIAFHGLRNKILYPMLSSTAARTRMKLEKSSYMPTTLQYLCCEKIGRHVPSIDAVEKLPLPPGMKRHVLNHMDWVIKVHSSHNV